MLIRLFVADDAPALSRLFHASVHEVGSRDYSGEQLSAWSPSPPDPSHLISRASDGRIFYVAVDDLGEPLAFGDLEDDGHIDYLYCRPDVVGTGIASALFDEIERTAVKRGMLRLYTEASEAARRFFVHKGFTVEKRRDREIDRVAIHNYQMVKTLRPCSGHEPMERDTLAGST